MPNRGRRSCSQATDIFRAPMRMIFKMLIISLSPEASAALIGYTAFLQTPASSGWIDAEIVSSGVARFFLVNHTKNWENITNGHKIYILNGHKIYQISVKYTHHCHFRVLQNVPKLGFWNADIPSGNPVF
jgi:hypothetical protein